MTSDVFKEIILIVGGVTGAMSVIIFLASNLATAAIKEYMKNEYEKNRQLEQDGRKKELEELKKDLLVELEREKLKHSFIVRRSELAREAISEITDHCYEVANVLAKEAVMEASRSERYRSASSIREQNKILLQVIESPEWSRWRNKYQALRTKLEGTNEILSRYSIQIEIILHPDTMRQIISSDFVLSAEKKIKPSDYRYVLSLTWKLVGSCLSALGKLTTFDERFWMLSESKENYGRKLDGWVIAEREHMIDTIKQVSAAKGLCDWRLPELPAEEFMFYMKIEEDDGVNVFWKYIEDSSNNTLDL